VKNKGAIYKRLAKSFLTILLIPLLAVGIFGLLTYQEMESYVKRSNSNMLETIRSACDEKIEYYQNMLLQVSRNDSVQSVYRSGKTNKEYLYQKYLLAAEIKDFYAAMKNGENYCEGLFVYLEEEDCIISQTGSNTLEGYLKELRVEEDYATIRNYLLQPGFLNDYYVKRVQSKENYSILITTTTNNVTVGLWLNIEMFDDIINSSSWADGFEWLIINDTNEYIRKPQLLQLSDGAQSESGDSKLVLDGKDYISSEIGSGVMGWKYLLLIPEYVINGAVTTIRNSFIVCMLGCLLVAYFCFGKVLQINYEPIMDLMDVFKDKEESDECIPNEHLYLKGRAEQLMSEYSTATRNLRSNSEILKRYYLENVLQGRLPQEKKKENWEKYVGSFETKQNTILLLEWDNPDINNVSEEKLAEERDLRRFIVKNVSKECVGMHYAIETVDLPTSFVIIISHERVEPEFNRDLENIIRGMQDFVFEHFQFSVYAAVGESHSGYEGVQQSYVECCQAADFFSVLDQDYICYKDIKDSINRTYGYSFEIEQCIVSALRADDAVMARSMIKKIFDMSFASRDSSPELLKCLIYDLFSTILKVSEEKSRNSAEILNLKGITIRSPREGIEKKFGQMVDYVCEREDKDDRNAQRCQMILDYIKENYADRNLCVSQIGEYFGMTSFYLSSIYKNQTGKSILEVINEIRVQKAIPLLMEGYTISEVIEMVGFSDSSYFIKVFKKIMGVTPGQVKKGVFK